MLVKFKNNYIRKLTLHRTMDEADFEEIFIKKSSGTRIAEISSNFPTKNETTDFFRRLEVILPLP